MGDFDGYESAFGDKGAREELRAARKSKFVAYGEVDPDRQLGRGHQCNLKNFNKQERALEKFDQATAPTAGLGQEVWHVRAAQTPRVSSDAGARCKSLGRFVSLPRSPPLNSAQRLGRTGRQRPCRRVRVSCLDTAAFSHNCAREFLMLVQECIVAFRKDSVPDQKSSSYVGQK